MSAGVGLQNAVRHTVAAQRKTHPAHGHVIVKQMAGYLDKMRDRYPDDPLIAAEYLLRHLPALKGHFRRLEEWATSVSGCDPADAPAHYRARLE